ncbi:hypothetical protein ACHAWF_014553 [Thalassiosira exigua]
MPPPYPRPGASRTPPSLRPLSAELSPLSRSDGSASLKAGDTHVLCAVHGPSAPRSYKWERWDRGVVSVAFSRGLMAGGSGASGAGSGPSVDDGGGADGERGSAAPAPPSSATTKSKSTMTSVPVAPPPGLGATERELEAFLRDALSHCIMLERYPRCVVQIVVQVVQSDGGAAGCALNCAALALMDAGVAMRGLPVAATCAVVPGFDGDEPTIWLDPTAEEEGGEGHAVAVHVTDASSSSATAGRTPAAGNGGDEDEEIVASLTFGAPISLKGLMASVEGARTSSAAVAAFMRLAVEQKVKREVQTLWS